MPMYMRRQRLLTFCAVVIVFMLYRVVQNSWDDSNVYADLRSGYNKAPGAAQPPPPADYNGAADTVVVSPVERPQQAPVKSEYEKEDSDYKSGQDREEEEEEEEDLGVKIPELKDKDANKAEDTKGSSSQGSDRSYSEDTEEDEFDRSAYKGNPTYEPDDIPTKTSKGELDIQWKNPPNDESNKVIMDKPKVHWKKFPEHFPVPEESIIPLPTGKPKEIPKIQFGFKEETESDKKSRTKRLDRVKTEISRSWAAYREYAWMNDELKPLSLKQHNPFCGWGATLVDSLDTLWIAGLEEEFDEAARAVADIDFTTTKRNDIPVFETSIRYLGGLLGAFDVSGGHKGDYKILLDKAVELAEILMSIFDTPNRMPLLYYQWKPEHASQPHRAGRVGVAELATLSMEFTRLAQLTKEDKYYDAIDRITDGLVELQAAGTHIPGLFPENLDISGCNKTATTIRDNLSKEAQTQLDSEKSINEPEGYVPESRTKQDGTDSKPGHGGEPTVKEDDRVEKRDLEQEVDLSEGEWKTLTDSESKNRPPFAADGHSSEWDCVPQGIIPSGYGYQVFHMGGAQDSAYEYFPKEYLLLGGLESKYQKLYEDAVEAVNNWLLFRPMGSDDWDILFPAKVSTNSRADDDLIPQFEITHLTCFIGGMYGLGGKIFGRQADVEMAKQLTDGCVWAYQLMPSGLMAESSRVIPCPDLDKCEFNETMWYDRLDQSKAWRERELARWEKEAAELQEAARLSEAANLEDTSNPELGAYSSDKAKEADELEQSALDFDDDDSEDSERDSILKRAVIPPQGEKSDEAESELPESLKKKLVTKGDEENRQEWATDDNSKTKHEYETHEKPVKGADNPKSIPQFSVPQRMTPDRKKPLSHEEFVKKRIDTEGLPPGFTELSSRNYILRPEAIESVWYMYRITGDPIWMDKGWAMFEATLQATRTEHANSAVGDVTQSVPTLMDSMESFWIAETLKYYYLLFSEPDVINLDEWVLNTEAHPFRRPT